VAVGARLLDLLRQHEVDLVVQALDFRLELVLEILEHEGWKLDALAVPCHPPRDLGPPWSTSEGPGAGRAVQTAHHPIGRVDRRGGLLPRLTRSVSARLVRGDARGYRARRGRHQRAEHGAG